MKEQKDSKIKIRNEKYISSKLNVYESYVVDSIAKWDAPKLRNVIVYKEININKCINDKGVNFLHYACAKQDAYTDKKDSINIINILIGAGANIFAKNSDGLTPKDYAQIKNHTNNLTLIRYAEEEINRKKLALEEKNKNKNG